MYLLLWIPIISLWLQGQIVCLIAWLSTVDKSTFFSPPFWWSIKRCYSKAYHSISVYVNCSISWSALCCSIPSYGTLFFAFLTFEYSIYIKKKTLEYRLIPAFSAWHINRNCPELWCVLDARWHGPGREKKKRTAHASFHWYRKPT